MKPIILAAYEDLIMQAALKKLLGKEKYNLTFASNGYEVLEHINVYTPDLILLEESLPGIPGPGVIQMLRGNPRCMNIPILIITDRGDDEAVIRGLKAGADDFVAKPFKENELKARIKSILRLNRYRVLLSERMKFEWVVENSDDGYLIIDNNDEVLYLNPKAKDYLRISHKTTIEIGKSLGKFRDLAERLYTFEPEKSWDMWPFIMDAFYYLVRPETKNRGALWLRAELFSDSRFRTGQKMVRLSDVTDSMVSNRTVKVFHHLIAHKLRTPMSGIMASAHILSKSFSFLSEKEIIEMADILVQDSKRLKNQLDQISRLLYVEEESYRQGGESKTQVSKIRNMVQDTCTEAELPPIELEVPENIMDLEIPISEQNIAIILREIINNSIKFHPENKPQMTFVLSQFQKIYVRMQVTDDGQHLSPEDISKIWTPYYQGEKYFTGQLEGMGLGLSIVSSIMWSSGGRCRAWNREDSPGLIMQLDFPLYREQGDSDENGNNEENNDND